MPVIESDVVEQPDDDASVWRYMSFEKFVLIMETQKLHFPRADKFQDPFEGTTPQSIREKRRKRYEESDEFDAEMDDIHAEFNRTLREFTFVNCWHQNDTESAAMWDSYDDKAIAIRTDFGSLKQVLDDHDDHPIYLGRVNYDTYGSTDTADEDSEVEKFLLGEGGYNTVAPFFQKRESFEHEQEVRATLHMFPVLSDDSDFGHIDYNMIVNGEKKHEKLTIATNEGEKTVDMTEEPKTQGVDVSVNLKELIDEVYVAPYVPEWFSDAVEESVESSDNLGDIVTLSDIDANPNY